MDGSVLPMPTVPANNAVDLGGGILGSLGSLEPYIEASEVLEALELNQEAVLVSGQVELDSSGC